MNPDRYPGYRLGRYDHVMVDHTPPRRDSAPGIGARVKAAMTEVRAIEARRRADAVAADLAALAARVTELEHPTPTDPDPAEPRHDRGTDDDTGRVALTGADTEWLVGRWRDNGWHE